MKNLQIFTWHRESDLGNLYPNLMEKIVIPCFKNEKYLKKKKLFKVFLY